MAKDELVPGYAQALFHIVKAEGELDRVEDEMYRLGKLLESNHELKQALSDQSVDLAQRDKMLEELLAGKISPHTIEMTKFVLGQGRGRQLPQIFEEVSRLAAEARESVVAEVRSAVALDDKQSAELAKALSQATKKKVTVKVIVDPSLIGGVVAKVGDTVIDGSVKSRLEQLKTQVRG